ncbi:GNAT family N-acetyltransferase [Paenibacillus sp. TRM 82003]|uniref:GNAT family N-acetyltransferase n=1 Tax=Kineococcus sp. TRM81007 TaxID=2925831 RepID=UPI001F599B76|nr:GNAT family N-acetyltransferase [Kineococcus sp. TRM81007]MCI2239140.1 GNAT family N-acetyltransferase [Kineococcus sp. TRM81007]MCI3924819.1 GNAT family N-acetyltransferase [Paenibacillus sp. TRM 82003]
MVDALTGALPPAPRSPGSAPGPAEGPAGTGLAVVRDPAEGLQVSVRRSLDGAPVPEWRALAVRAGHPPFCGPDWLRAVHEHLGAGEPLLVSVRRQGRLLALGAFAVLGAGPGGSRPVVTFLGAGGSDYASLPTDPDSPVPAVRLVAAALDAVLAEVPGALFDLEQVLEDDPLLEAAGAWAAARGYGARLLRQATVHAVRLPATVAEHDAALGRHARHEERRQWRRLAERGRLVVVDDLLDGLAELREADPDAAGRHLATLAAELAAVDAAHPNAARRRQPWRGASGRTLVRFLGTAPRGVAQLSGLRVDDRLVAYAFCLAGPRALHGYVQSYRAEVAATGPGTLLLLRVRRRALLSGYAELDLLRGEEAYKRRFERTTRHTVRLTLAPTGLPLLPAAVDRAVLLRRTYRDELQRSARLGRSVQAVAGAAGNVRADLTRRAAAVRTAGRRAAGARGALSRARLAAWAGGSGAGRR